MAKTNNTTTPGRKAHNYEVSNATAALLDCIIAADKLYTQIGDALELRYGKTGVDSATPPYLAAINTLNDLIHQELQGQVIDALMSVEATAAETITI